MRRRPLIAILVVGLGLVAAPAVFQMFTRAPAGGEMIDDFRPLMTAERLDAFDAHLETIDAARDDTTQLAGTLEGFDDRFGATAEFNDSWPEINGDMSGMLATIRGNLDNFEAVDALPPFPLFPWFFVAPGVLLALVAANAMRRRRLTVLAWGFLMLLGLGLVGAPAVFQMFSRAPAGGEMIDDFRPVMTGERVTTMQNYFLTLAAMEGELRNRIAPEVDGFDSEFPQAASFTDQWPQISRDMAPMVGAMADNLDNFAAVDALPPFSLFPWFFVAPGVIVLVLGFVAGRTPKRRAPTRSVIRGEATRR